MSLARRYMEQAAQFVSDHPERFEFFESAVPRSTRQFGCALGWTAYHMNQERNWFRRIFLRSPRDLEATARLCGFLDESHFYRSMDVTLQTCKWRTDPFMCAMGLRLLARREWRESVETV